jgi:hypothetical protein
MPGHEEEIDRWRFRLNKSFHPNQKSPGNYRGFSIAQ